MSSFTVRVPPSRLLHLRSVRIFLDGFMSSVHTIDVGFGGDHLLRRYLFGPQRRESLNVGRHFVQASSVRDIILVKVVKVVAFLIFIAMEGLTLI